MVNSALLPLICLKKVQKLGHLIIHSEVFVAFYCYMEVFLLHNSSKTSLQCSWSFRDPTFYTFLLDKCENYSTSIRYRNNSPQYFTMVNVLHIAKPRRACAARVYSTWVCVSVC
ncbi:hypothetical protein GBAR_LOCUS18979, partial [Geodia barretti]